MSSQEDNHLSKSPREFPFSKILMGNRKMPQPEVGESLVFLTCIEEFPQLKRTLNFLENAFLTKSSLNREMFLQRKIREKNCVIEEEKNKRGEK